MKAQKLSLLPTSMTNKSLTFRQGLVFILSNFKIGWWAGNSIKPIITHPTNIDYLSRLTMELSRERRLERRRRASGVRRLLRLVGEAGTLIGFPSTNSYHQPAQLLID